MDFKGEDGTTAKNLAQALLTYGDRPVRVVILDKYGRELPCEVRLRYALGGAVEMYVVPL